LVDRAKEKFCWFCGVITMSGLPITSQPRTHQSVPQNTYTLSLTCTYEYQLLHTTKQMLWSITYSSYLKVALRKSFAEEHSKTWQRVCIRVLSLLSVQVKKQKSKGFKMFNSWIDFSEQNLKIVTKVQIAQTHNLQREQEVNSMSW
jgi:very-short-patch-repair endonuclease